MPEILNLYFKVVVFLLDFSWVWLPFFLIFAFFESWMYYIQRQYWWKLEWLMLEVKSPRDIEMTPKNMEQIFAGLWGSWGTVSTKADKYLRGIMQDYFSFEIVGINGEVHFYLRTVKKYRDFVEAQIYSQYPQAEIKEVEDYVHKLPADVPNKDWNLWGCCLKLAKDSVYPIRSYEHLIDLTKSDQPFLDPLAGLMEAMGKLRPGEQLWIQVVFRPVPDDWQKKSRVEVDRLMGKKASAKDEGILAFDIRTWWQTALLVVEEIFTGSFTAPESQKKEEGPPSLMMFLSPGEKEVISGIEEKAAKKGYEVKIQWAYIGRRDLFTMANVSATMGIFNQFANLNMNSLKPLSKTMTKAAYLLAKYRKAFKQRILMRLLRQRSFWEKGFIFNIEELATLYHFPTIGVKAPITPYVGVTKGSAPVDLPIE